jgi:hypothetical protein
LEAALLDEPDEGRRVRRASAGNLLADPEKLSNPFRDGADAVEVEDALDLIGGLGWYQFRHIGLLSFFWFFNVGTSMSVFVNSPWCVGEGALGGLCQQSDIAVGKSPEVWWGECRSVSCQFNLQPAFCGNPDAAEPWLDDAGEACQLSEAGSECAVTSGDCGFVEDNGRVYLRPLFDRCGLAPYTVHGRLHGSWGR